MRVRPTMRFNGSWINATYCVCVCAGCVHPCGCACMLLLTDACYFFFPFSLLTAVINGEQPWLGTKLLLNSLTFCVIVSGQFAEGV